MRTLETFRRQMNEAIEEAKRVLAEPQEGKGLEFNIRGRLYDLAMRLSPHAREDDLEAMKGWINPKKGEICIDMAAGTGFLTKSLVEWTEARVYAVDYSQIQLAALAAACSGQVVPIIGSLAQESGRPGRTGILEHITEQVDFITSFGGMHHIYYQKRMMEHAEKLLKSGGRIVAADVGGNTPLAWHFDDVVAKKCLTGHTARWLTEERLRELVLPLDLELIQCEMKTLHWLFGSRAEMALFFKGLHAYDVGEDEIVDDLYDALGFEESSGRVKLNWPMLFFEIQKG